MTSKRAKGMSAKLINQCLVICSDNIWFNNRNTKIISKAGWQLGRTRDFSLKPNKLTSMSSGIRPLRYYVS